MLTTTTPPETPCPAAPPATPAVVTDVGGTRELVTDGVHALLVARHDVAALTRALARVMDAPDDARIRADAARRRVETELSFDRRMRQVEAVYDELTRSRRSGTTPHPQQVLPPSPPRPSR